MYDNNTHRYVWNILHYFLCDFTYESHILTLYRVLSMLSLSKWIEQNVMGKCLSIILLEINRFAAYDHCCYTAMDSIERKKLLNCFPVFYCYISIVHFPFWSWILSFFPVVRSFSNVWPFVSSALFCKVHQNKFS